jgi:hypothetical protein
MADLPVRRRDSSLLRLAGEADQGLQPAQGDRTVPTTDQPGETASIGARDASPSTDSEWGHLAGFLLVAAGGVLAALGPRAWSGMLAWAGDPWAGEESRWIVVALLVTTGISFLRARPIFFVIASALFGATVYCADLLAGQRISKAVDALLSGREAARGLGIVASLGFGYLVHTDPRVRAPSLRGILGFVLVGLAGLGTLRGWYDWQPAAERLGPGALRLAAEWSAECTWATVLVLTAVGVSMSRTRPIHFLNAVLLVGLAYHCIKSGTVQMREFPELAAGQTVRIEDVSYTNVAVWRWVVAFELVCLASVLVHMSLGMGGLKLAFAALWMVGGMWVYDVMGTMSMVRTVNEGTRQEAMNPLGNWGLPVVPPAGATPVPGVAGATPTGRTVLAGPGGDAGPQPGPAMTPAQRELARQILVREITPWAWMLLIALCAGIMGVSGLRMMSDHAGYRAVSSGVLWMALGVGTTALWMVWPRNPDQGWDGWIAAWRFSRYHVYVFWLAFIGTMALASPWALRRGGSNGGWMHASVAAIFLGTCASIVGVAVLIQFGRFPPLPAWVYGVLAAGQSSLAWAILLQVGRAERRAVMRAGRG